MCEEKKNVDINKENEHETEWENYIRTTKTSFYEQLKEVGMKRKCEGEGEDD